MAIVNPIVSRLLDTLIHLAQEELNLILGIPEEIQKLRYTLRSIQAVLNNAEQQQFTQETVKLWLSNLKEVMYDADDILDEYQIVAEKWASQEHPLEEPSIGLRMLHFCACFHQVRFTHEIGSRIKDLNQRMELISNYKSRFDLKVDCSIPDKKKVVAQLNRTTFAGVEHDIVGETIEKNTRDLVDLLKKEEENANFNVVVFAIVGLGGIGKTTLAQKIFNDNEIKAFFQKTMWVCVSQEFVEANLLKEIIKSAGGSPGEAESKAQLESKVKEVLKDNKFLLVLDDVWNVQIWENLLRNPLQVGTVGSKVLVTTRNEGVAKRMKAFYIHSMNPLPLDDSWLLLCKKVTKNTDEERQLQSLKDIGMKIVEKCQGLPLAITVIGGVLCGEFKRWKWQEVECSSAWSRRGLPEEIHEALYLSYQDLPSQLRECFLYCSLFREDSIIDKESLVQLWAAEGFVIKGEGEEYLSLEEIAQGYYDELVQRSLLQGYEERTNEKAYCKMHDLLRSLCHFLARGESSVISDITDNELPSTADDDSIKLRRLSIAATESARTLLLRLTQSQKSVRTLLLQGPTLDGRDVEDCFNNLPRLRVVHLRYTEIQSLPQSIGRLLHLRYLNLSNCYRMEALPESITSLNYLQFLILERCYQLQTLPKGVVKLRNLKTLNLDDAGLKELPSGIARLEHLNVFKGAVISSISGNNCSSSCSLEEISQLRKLRKLSICNLGLAAYTETNQNVNRLNSSLMAFKNLVALDLIFGQHFFNWEQEVATDIIERIENIFDEALCPPSCVRKIIFDGFRGRQFPWWLMSSSISSFLPNLTNLKLSDCHSCLLLPPLGKLPNLEELELVDIFAVERIGAEFYGYDEASTSVGHEGGGSNFASFQMLFPRLKRLHLERFVDLKEWHWVPEGGRTVAMPELNELVVYSCRKLSSLPVELKVFRLTKLYIGHTKLNVITGFCFVKYMWIQDTIELNLFAYHPMLEVLDVYLKEMHLPDWLAQGIPHLPSLHTLQFISMHPQQLRKCLKDSPNWHKISHIPVVEISFYKEQNHSIY